MKNLFLSKISQIVKLSRSKHLYHHIKFKFRCTKLLLAPTFLFFYFFICHLRFLPNCRLQTHIWLSDSIFKIQQNHFCSFFLVLKTFLETEKTLRVHHLANALIANLIRLQDCHKKINIWHKKLLIQIIENPWHF